MAGESTYPESDIIILPLAHVYDHTQVLMTYDFSSKARDLITKEYPISTLCDQKYDENSSLITVSEHIRTDKMLRELVGFPLDDDELMLLGPEEFTIETRKLTRIPMPITPDHNGRVPIVWPSVVSRLVLNRNTDLGEHRNLYLNKVIEHLLIVRELVYFLCMPDTPNSSICGLLVNHKSTFFLNGCEGKPLSSTGCVVPTSNHDGTPDVASQTNMPSPTITRREHYYIWVCIKDVDAKLMTLCHNLRGPYLNDTMANLDDWVQKSFKALDGVQPSSVRHNGNESNIETLRSARSEGSNIESRHKQTTVSDRFEDIGLNHFSRISIEQLKDGFRHLVWDLMDQKQEIMYPHTCHGRIPNFRGREAAAENLAALSTFKTSRVIKINPSSAQEHVRFLTLACSKVLITPSPALERGSPFFKVDPTFLSRKQIQRAATKVGACTLGAMVSLAGLGNLRVQLVIVGSVVVNPITGARIGKGQGYCDLEYAIMAQLGVVSLHRTVVATVVHESQLLSDLPDEVMENHDLPVNLIATPKRVIFTRCSFDRPEQIYWSKITEEMMNEMPALQDLRELIEHKSRESECYTMDAMDESLDEYELPDNDILETYFENRRQRRSMNWPPLDPRYM